MFLTKHSNGFYYIIYDNEYGKRTKISTKCKLKSDAHRFLAEFSKQLEERKSREHLYIDLKSFIYVYSKHSESIHTPKTTESLKWVFKDFQKFFGNPLIHKITLQNIQDYLNYKRKVSVYTGQKHLAYLRSAFNYAKKQKYILYNYFEDISNFRLPEKQPKYFKPEEYQILLNSVTEKWFRNIIEIAFNTGMRQMEILNLKWEEVDLISEHIIISNQTAVSKSKKIRVLPLNKIAKEVLSLLDNSRESSVVFHNEGNLFKQDHISKKFKKHVRRVNINQALNFHSLRHTFASRLVQRGVSIYHVSKLLGHASVTTTSIYAHLRTEDLRKSIKMLD